MAKETVEIKKSYIHILLVVIAVIAIASVVYQFNGFGATGYVAASDQEGMVLTIVNDEDCASCGISTLAEQLEEMFTDLEVREVSYSSREGKALLSKFDLEGVPALFFNSDIKKDSAFSQIESYIETKDDVIYLRTEVTKFVHRTQIPKKIDLFVMSQCPFGTPAEATLIEVLKTLPQLDWDVHFIADVLTEDEYNQRTERGKSMCHKKEDGLYYCSLHGQVELDEDIRQTCIMEHYQEKYTDYLSCVNDDIENVETKWKKCASDNSIDTDKIESCFRGEEGRTLLKDNIAVTNELGISSSPTFLGNNQMLFASGSPEHVKDSICGMNQGMGGCGETLSNEQGTASGGCSG